MDYLTGGDLRYHLCERKTFTEEQTKFFMGCIILGLEYIHTNSIIHRDIKPENLVCDDKGYIRITDFGVAKKHHTNNSDETSGTPGYMAPEVLCARKSLDAADLFNKLIQRKVNNRIGTNGIEEIKANPWFYGFSWMELYEKKMESPFVPPIGDNFDRRYCESDEPIGDVTLDRYRLYRKNDNYDGILEIIPITIYQRRK